MKHLFILLLILTSQAFAGCESTVNEYISRHKNFKLHEEKSVMLLPKMNAQKGYFNRWKFRVEVFFLSESDRDSALIVHAENCRALERQELVASLR